MRLIPKLSPQDGQRRAALKRQLKRHEAVIGGQLFGPIPEGHHREFFCLDARTWVWHEEWEENGHRQSVTTHYNIRPEGILKQQGDQYRRLTKQETHNLCRAAELYKRRMDAEYYQLLSAAK